MSLARVLVNSAFMLHVKARGSFVQFIHWNNKRLSTEQACVLLVQIAVAMCD